jgi:transposase
VGKWRTRFIKRRLEGLLDAPRSGAPRKIGDDQVEKVIVTTLESMPKGASRWSTRDMAAKAGISRESVSRIWRAFGLKPHRRSTFQLSKDPQFVEKVRDVVGLYMAPPENAVVLCVDEKSQIQALNRTQPLLPMRPGQLERGTPEYERHGTTTLFAALDVATGGVIGKCFHRHRATEFIKFLTLIDEAVDARLQVHLILDNYATHKTPRVRSWLVRHRRFQLHFIPTHASWLNEVECWFSILSEKQLKRGSHLSVRVLEQAIYAFLKAHNNRPKPFKWTKSADEILAKVARYCAQTITLHAKQT